MNQDQIQRTLAVEADLEEGILSTGQIAEKHGVATLVVNLILEEMARKDEML
jgi:hypothetical protein